MANALKKLAQAQLGTSDAAVFTVPGGKTWVINEIHVSNTDTAQRTFRLHHVDAAGSSSASNALAYDTPIDGAALVAFGRGHVYETGQMLRGKADVASKVTVTVLGIEVS